MKKYYEIIDEENYEIEKFIDTNKRKGKELYDILKNTVFIIGQRIPPSAANFNQQLANNPIVNIDFDQNFLLNLNNEITRIHNINRAHPTGTSEFISLLSSMSSISKKISFEQETWLVYLEGLIRKIEDCRNKTYAFLVKLY
ncbi:MAG: hypothetical protein J0M18_18060 [Ignavibacteria bacterium]|nr:hypothetical protein [Ignavibacteria bacterium]